jgi:glycyl-tRNA synthetase
LDTFDLEYQFPFGWKELWGIAYRTDFDLKQHMITSGKNLEYTDPVTNRTFIPHVIEPAVGLNRLLLMILLETFQEEEKRSVLKLKPALAPRTVAVFPLVANKPALVEKARTIYTQLQLAGINIAWDDRGNIGKRYLSQDEAGTPWCVTVDYATLEDNTVTVRDRDTTSQVRVSISELALYFREKLQ